MNTLVCQRRARGFTLMELVVTVSVVGLLAAVAIPSYSGYYSATESTVARNLVETLNGAVHRFNECNYELNVPAVASSTTDEMSIVRTLQYRNPTNPVVGSPYLKTDWNPVASSSSNDYRIVWAGTLFQLLSPGQTGTGLKVQCDGGDIGAPYVFPPGFTLAGQ
jgi:type IV pilus assembly protein PilE